MPVVVLYFSWFWPTTGQPEIGVSSCTITRKILITVILAINWVLRGFCTTL